jgi:hypothetical protein
MSLLDTTEAHLEVMSFYGSEVLGKRLSPVNSFTLSLELWISGPYLVVKTASTMKTTGPQDLLSERYAYWTRNHEHLATFIT